MAPTAAHSVSSEATDGLQDVDAIVLARRHARDALGKLVRQQRVLQSTVLHGYIQIYLAF